MNFLITKLTHPSLSASPRRIISSTSSFEMGSPGIVHPAIIRILDEKKNAQHLCFLRKVSVNIPISSHTFFKDAGVITPVRCGSKR